MRPPLGTSNEAISDAKRKRISPSDKQPSEALSEIIKRNQGVTVLPRDHLHASEAECIWCNATVPAFLVAFRTSESRARRCIAKLILISERTRSNATMEWDVSNLLAAARKNWKQIRTFRPFPVYRFAHSALPYSELFLSVINIEYTPTRCLKRFSSPRSEMRWISPTESVPEISERIANGTRRSYRVIFI